MIKNYKLHIFILFLSMIFSVSSYAASATPSSYKTTVSKVELCTSSACTTTTVLGSSSKTFDIASASAGADVGTYLSDFTLPIGTTFTHMRSTINVTFKMKGTVDVSGTTCNTVASPTVAASSATITGKTAAGGTLGEMSWTVPDTNGGGDYSDLTSTYSTNGITKVDGASTFTFVNALTVPYTPKATDVPRIKMSFDVKNTLVATTSGTTCIIYLDPPVMSVTITGR